MLRESSRERRVGDGAGSSSSEAGRAHEGDGGDMGCVGVDGKYFDKLQLCTCTGPSTRGMINRHCPQGCESGIDCARAC